MESSYLAQFELFGRDIKASQQTQHTLGHHKCPPCERYRAQLICSITSDLEFSTAAKQWVDARSVTALPGAISARYIRKNTEESYRQYIRTLELFFVGMKLGDIRLHHFAAYQRARLQGDEPFVRYRRPQDAKGKMINGAMIPPKGKIPCPVKPKKVNQELGLLQHIMKRANCWTGEMGEIYQTILDDEEEMPRALNPEEQRLWLDTARLKERWNKVYFYSIFAFGTCMSTDELRGIRLGDLNLFQQIVVVKRKTAKNTHRARTIELVGGDVLWAAEKLIEMASELGSREAHHYLFPWRVKLGEFDPEKPMSESGIKVPWNEVRAQSGLTWFRQYDCRHTAITRLAEEGVPTDIIMARAGHISEKMRRHYTHISQSAQRKWIERAQTIHHTDRFRPQSVRPWGNAAQRA